VLDAAPQPARKPAARKPAPTPEVLNLDFTTDVSLNACVASYEVESHLQRCLLIAAWFNECRETPTITPAHMYTAYRWLKWPLNIDDFAQPLRSLKAKQLFGSTEKGTYTINHLGLQRVAETTTVGE